MSIGLEHMGGDFLLESRVEDSVNMTDCLESEAS